MLVATKHDMTHGAAGQFVLDTEYFQQDVGAIFSFVVATELGKPQFLFLPYANCSPS